MRLKFYEVHWMKHEDCGSMPMSERHFSLKQACKVAKRVKGSVKEIRGDFEPTGINSIPSYRLPEFMFD